MSTVGMTIQLIVFRMCDSAHVSIKNTFLLTWWKIPFVQYRPFCSRMSCLTPALTIYIRIMFPNYITWALQRSITHQTPSPPPPRPQKLCHPIIHDHDQSWCQTQTLIAQIKLLSASLHQGRKARKNKRLKNLQNKSKTGHMQEVFLSPFHFQTGTAPETFPSPGHWNAACINSPCLRHVCKFAPCAVCRV